MNVKDKLLAEGHEEVATAEALQLEGYTTWPTCCSLKKVKLSFQSPWRIEIDVDYTIRWNNGLDTSRSSTVVLDPLFTPRKELSQLLADFSQ